MAHVNYYQMKQARQFTDASILVLEAAIVDAQLKFDQVPAFAGLLILKHLLSFHSAQNIHLGGSPINRTAKMFENKLQWVKRECARGNFRNPIWNIVDSWSLHTARDLSRLTSSSRHEVHVVFASDEAIVSYEILALEDSEDVVVSMLQALLSGGDPEQLYAFAHVENATLHSVSVVPGSFIYHWSDDHPTRCLALVTQMIQLRKEEEGHVELWFDVFRFPGVVAPSHGTLRVSADDWAAHVVDPCARVRVLEQLDQLRFTLVRQCPVPRAYSFI